MCHIQPIFFVSSCLLFAMPPQYPEHLKMKQAECSPCREATFTNDTSPELTLLCWHSTSLDTLQGFGDGSSCQLWALAPTRALATTVSQQPEAPATAAQHPRAPQHSWQVTNAQVIKFLRGRHDLTQEKLVETKGLDPSNTHFFLHLMKCSNECSSVTLICWK